MILLAMLLQAAQPPASPPPARPPADILKPIDLTLAIDSFRALCWTTFRDPAAFRAAVVNGPLPLAAVRGDAPGQGAEVYRSDEAVLTYVASDTLPVNVPARQCRLKVRVASSVDQLALAARIGTALAIPSGRTKTDPAGAETSWDVAAPDGRVVRLLAVTRNGPGSGTEVRLSALLLAAR